MEPPEAGIVSRIRLENFMCHESLQIEFGNWVNFVTGQNGSGKSAILTALCVAFGCRAKGTQRAATLKDFIKNGCSSATICVEIKNKGVDAFKREIYGDVIVIERRITETTSSTILKDHLGKKVSQRKDELRELIEHFNIDVENPCVIMSQDKSREFLHSGNNKDKFKFFFKATLLQQVSDLLQSVSSHLDSANATVDELESSIRPIQKELDELSEKIKNMEHIEEIAEEAKKLKKRLAWSWVYGIDKQIQDQEIKLATLKDRIPRCQEKIDRGLAKLKELNAALLTKKSYITSLMEKTSEVRRTKDEMQQSLSLATKEKYALDEEYARKNSSLQKTADRILWLQQQVNDIQEQHIRSTQAEVNELDGQLKRMQDDIDTIGLNITRLRKEEDVLFQSLSTMKDAIKNIAKEVEENERRFREISHHICELQQRQTNKVTAFGGERVLNLLRAIERHHQGFSRPPIGPIGAHVTLIGGDLWAFAIESSLGKLLDAFIVTDNRDLQLLRRCAREANYSNVPMYIYDFSRPRLNIPRHMLPSTDQPTIFSVLHSNNPVIMNVLVDMGNVERQVLADDYEMGKRLAFEQRIQNLKDVYTSDGFRMFRRGFVETILPPNRRARASRLCGSVEEHIRCYEDKAAKVRELLQEGNKRKRSSEQEINHLNMEIQKIKRQRMNEEGILKSKEIKMRDLRNSYAAENITDREADVDELDQEILKVQHEMQEQEISLEKIKANLDIARIKARDMKLSLEQLCDSAKGDIGSIEEAEHELLVIEQNIRTAEEEKAHYENVMNNKVLPDIKVAERLYEDLQLNHKENFEKASIICPESEVEALGGCAGKTPEQLSAQLNRLKQRLQHESNRYTESIDDLRILHGKKERQISKKQQIYKAIRQKLDACQKALDLRWTKFQRNASLLKREITWKFNGHLGKKGISGQINVNYEEKSLSIQVKMPHDASRESVRDTRGLSGGERSFSTLCFALALHDLTEAPFRAMDEFDVFMDAVSRKISLAALVEFAVTKGSQWIFITPHDISTINSGDKIKKQQMAAPRG